ncbi:MAG: hypothetical protein BAA01_09855 [Bacillus thermozeamaize]|uniref:DUF429 domain-containing protein n=1 Tax=Bacillus thermozeamaize TaxID=230954 RepID=A0A1Y3PG61_9BACI|nr:MAG: hypothetical protein BAA01_09855 [Bacillus thermozeamaize]
MAGNITRKIRKAYGIDLAGFTSTKTAIVEAVKDDNGRVTLKIIKNHPLNSEDLIKSKEYFLKLLEDPAVKVYIDAPMDLQGLPFDHLNSFRFPWQLTYRPVDKAYNGLPPFADKIGAVVSRFMYCLHDKDTDKSDPRHAFEKYENLFETYPAGSLKQLADTLRQPGIDKNYKNYKKGKVDLDSDGWKPAGQSTKDESLCNIAKALFAQAVAKEKLTINDDEFDAMICAVTGLLDRGSKLTEDGLQKAIYDKLEKKYKELSFEDCSPPKRYELINSLEELRRWEITIMESASAS